MLSLSKAITVPSSNKLNILEQQIRTMRINKPPWIPRSKAKAFRVPPMPVVDAEEKIFMDGIKRKYNAEMKSIYQLFKTEFKFSDKASLVAQEEKRKLKEQEEYLLEKNEERNNAILEQQLLDLDMKLDKKKHDVEVQLSERQRQEALYIQVADEKIKSLKEKVKSFIDPDNLEYEIEKMLNERNDYNFSINHSGKMFKNSIEVTRAEAFNAKFLPDEASEKSPVGETESPAQQA